MKVRIKGDRPLNALNLPGLMEELLSQPTSGIAQFSSSIGQFGNAQTLKLSIVGSNMLWLRQRHEGKHLLVPVTGRIESIKETLSGAILAIDVSVGARDLVVLAFGADSAAQRIQTRLFAGDDDFRLGAGDDRVDGGDGEDRIEGRGGKDLLRGGDDADRLFGGGQADRLQGGGGADHLEGGGGAVGGGGLAYRLLGLPLTSLGERAARLRRCWGDAAGVAKYLVIASFCSPLTVTPSTACASRLPCATPRPPSSLSGSAPRRRGFTCSSAFCSSQLPASWPLSSAPRERPELVAVATR